MGKGKRKHQMRETRDFFDINQNNWRISLQLRSTDSFAHFVVVFVSIGGEGENKLGSNHNNNNKTIPYKCIIFTLTLYSALSGTRATQAPLPSLLPAPAPVPVDPSCISLKMIWDVTPRFLSHTVPPLAPLLLLLLSLVAHLVAAASSPATLTRSFTVSL